MKTPQAHVFHPPTPISTTITSGRRARRYRRRALDSLIYFYPSFPILQPAKPSPALERRHRISIFTTPAHNTTPFLLFPSAHLSESHLSHQILFRTRRHQFIFPSYHPIASSSLITPPFGPSEHLGRSRHPEAICTPIRPTSGRCHRRSNIRISKSLRKKRDLSYIHQQTTSCLVPTS